MLKWKSAGLFAAAIFLAGCSAQQQDKVSEPVKTAHLPWPTELPICKFNFEFVGEGDKAYVRIPYQDWISKSQCEERTYTYIANLTALTCSYRVELNEYRCQIYRKENE